MDPFYHQCHTLVRDVNELGLIGFLLSLAKLVVVRLTGVNELLKIGSGSNRIGLTTTTIILNKKRLGNRLGGAGTRDPAENRIDMFETAAPMRVIR